MFFSVNPPLINQRSCDPEVYLYKRSRSKSQPDILGIFLFFLRAYHMNHRIIMQDICLYTTKLFWRTLANLCIINVIFNVFPTISNGIMYNYNAS